jgi:hypothetical protein
VAVDVDEAGEGEGLGHARDASNAVGSWLTPAGTP